MARTLRGIRIFAFAVALLVTLALSVGCGGGEPQSEGLGGTEESVEDNGQSNDQNNNQNNGQTNDPTTTNPPADGETTPPENSDPVDTLIPAEEQFDRNGFPNPYEDEATKRY